MLVKELDIYPMQEKYEQYLQDESKLRGSASSICFPETEEQILQTITIMRQKNIPITIQGSRTGIVGCAVPDFGHLLNLSNMNKIKETVITKEGTFLKVEPGVTLLELKKAMKKIGGQEELFWPPEPTETSATIGGIASCNAKGITSYLYGDTNNYIQAIKIIRADGMIEEIERGKQSICFLGKQIDLLDIYLGGEGMFGVIVELTLRLCKKPIHQWGISFFFEEKTNTFSFIEAITKDEPKPQKASMAAIEYLDKETIHLIEERKDVMTKLKEIPSIDTIYEAMVYIEIHGEEEEAVEMIAETLMEKAMEYSSDPEVAWAVSGEVEIEKMRAFRHAAAESVNMYIEKVRQQYTTVTKLATDMSIKEASFRDVICEYEKDAKEQEISLCIFGHAAANHVHVNLLPKDDIEYQKGYRLLEKWAEQIAQKSGKVVTEHGVGKLKKKLFLNTASKAHIEAIKQVKNTYDPCYLWNPNNMLDR